MISLITFLFFFSINFFDPVVSFATAAMLFGLSIPKFQKCFSILLETAPKNLKISELIKNFPFISKPEIKIFVAGDEKGNILTMKCSVDHDENKEKLLKKSHVRSQNGVATQAAPTGGWSGMFSRD